MSRGSVLIIEDEPLVQMLLEDICNSANCDVVATVDNVKDAVAAVKNLEFNVAILDVNLRKETSEEVARALTAKGKHALVSTGHHPSKLDPAFQEFILLQKPFRPAEVTMLLNQTAF